MARFFTARLAPFGRALWSGLSSSRSCIELERDLASSGIRVCHGVIGGWIEALDPEDGLGVVACFFTLFAGGYRPIRKIGRTNGHRVVCVLSQQQITW